MLSMPPATMISCVPASSMSCANIAAFMPAPHILDSVTAPALRGSPPLYAAWRAGAWPCPAMRQLPKMTSPTASPGMPARCTAALMAAPPRSCAASVEKSPWKPPMGVRAAPTMTMDSAMVFTPSSSLDERGAGLFFGDPADVFLEFGVFAPQQQRQCVVEVLAAAPFAHVVVPAVPAARFVFAHGALVGDQVGALEQRDQHIEDHQ